MSVSLFYDYIVIFLGKDYHDERGFKVVSILLLANLFLGIYYNLSIWYKLSEKTKTLKIGEIPMKLELLKVGQKRDVISAAFHVIVGKSKPPYV